MNLGRFRLRPSAPPALFSRTLLLFACCTGLALAQAKGAPADAANKTQKLELARAQAARDSIVAARWNAKRAQIDERERWQAQFERLRDSLESATDQRSTLLAEVRAIAPPKAAAPEAAEPTPASLDDLRRQLSERLSVLRDRVERGMPWALDVRLRSVDSASQAVAELQDPVAALSPALAAWEREWAFSREIERTNAVLPRPKGDELRGDLLRVGLLGAWYSGDTALAGALVRSGSADNPWEWREDLSTEASALVRDALAGRRAELPVDPGTSAVEGPGFFYAPQPTGFAAYFERFLDLKQGPFRVVALWAARASVLLLIGLGLAVALISFRRRAVLNRQERDASAYVARIMPAMHDATAAERLATEAAPDTVAGRLVRAGLANRHYSPEALEQVLAAQESAEARELERGLGFLGSVGSNAPFIGLFGTVCGVLDAFASLGQSGEGPQAVMSAIAEALIATAVGLLVAIPAVWLYNVLQLRAKNLLDQVRELRTLMVAASLESVARGLHGSTTTSSDAPGSAEASRAARPAEGGRGR